MARFSVLLAITLLVVCASFIQLGEAQNTQCVQRALSLVGKSRAEYVCNQVVNYALNGNKNVGGLAKDYLKYGVRMSTPAACRVVVGNDGAHVGIFISASEFVHSSSSKYQVIRVGLSQLPYVFPNGYQIRGYSLKGDAPEPCDLALNSLKHSLPVEVQDAVQNILPADF